MVKIMSDNSDNQHISLDAQYIKDLSFKNPNAPMSLIDAKNGPQVKVSLDINIAKMPDEGTYEVELSVTVHTSMEDKPLFTVELIYACVFSLQNFAEDTHKQVLAIHCPTLLFPFASKIIADVTQDAGFQPLMIDPIDFGMLYHKRMAEEVPLSTTKDDEEEDYNIIDKEESVIEAAEDNALNEEDYNIIDRSKDKEESE